MYSQFWKKKPFHPVLLAIWSVQYQIFFPASKKPMNLMDIKAGPATPGVGRGWGGKGRAFGPRQPRPPVGTQRNYVLSRINILMKWNLVNFASMYETHALFASFLFIKFVEITVVKDQSLIIGGDVTRSKRLIFFVFSSIKIFIDPHQLSTKFS